MSPGPKENSLWYHSVCRIVKLNVFETKKVKITSVVSQSKENKMQKKQN